VGRERPSSEALESELSLLFSRRQPAALLAAAAVLLPLFTRYFDSERQQFKMTDLCPVYAPFFGAMVSVR
jgi:hypothetical protein